MMRSSENYQRHLKRKVERIKSARKRKDSISSVKSNSADFTQQVISLVRKRESAYERREKLKKEFYEKINQRENFMTEKMKKIHRILEQENSNTEGKLQNLREKSLRTSRCIREMKKKQKNQIEYQQERHKLFEEEAIDNINMQKRIEALKKEKIIEKHLELHHRRNQHYQFLEAVNKKIREKTMNFTMQREKVLELKAKISKSQTPERIKKQFKSLNK